MIVLFTLLLMVYPGWMFAKQSSSQRAERYDGQPPAAPVYDGGPPRARNVRPAGEETPPDEASANPNSVAENNKQPATSAEAKPVHLDWIFTEHEGQKRDPSGILIQGQGFCFLSGVQGKFHGWADKVHVDVNKDNVWGVSGAGVEFNVDVKARAYSVETREPRPLSIGVNAYRWSPPSDGVRMLHKDEGLCVLTSFIGGLKADDHFVAVELADDGYYWLRGKSNDTTSTALATSVLLSRERTLNSQVTTYRWTSEMHRQPIRMIHSDEGICFLSGIYGPYSKPEDAARVYIDSDDGYWYLSGSSAEESLIAAQAIAVRFTGEIVD